MALELYDCYIFFHPFFSYCFVSKSRDFQDSGRENKKNMADFSLIFSKKKKSYFELVSA